MIRWFVFRDGSVYGPYVPEQLTAFLTPETLVVREGQKEWIAAASDPGLASVLSGAIHPALDWFIGKPGGEMRGPFSRAAVMYQLERGEIDPSDLVKHESWTDAVPISRTRLHAKWKNPSADLAHLSPAEILAAPRPRQDLPAPPARKISLAMPAMPRYSGAVIAAGALAIGVYAWSLFGPVSASPPKRTHPVVKSCDSEPTSDCSHDKVSQCVCRENPLYCLCKKKGSCGMEPCKNHKGPAL